MCTTDNENVGPNDPSRKMTNLNHLLSNVSSIALLLAVFSVGVAQDASSEILSKLAGSSGKLPATNIESVGKGLELWFDEMGISGEIPQQLFEIKWSTHRISQDELSFNFTAGARLDLLLFETGYSSYVSHGEIKFVLDEDADSCVFAKVHLLHGLSDELLIKWPDFVMDLISPSSWEKAGGKGTISISGRSATVHATAAVHDQIHLFNLIMETYGQGNE